MEDLSHLCPGLTGGESMNASNSVSDQRPAMSAPGQHSEATQGVTPTVPGPYIPPGRERTVVNPSAPPRVSSPWHSADGTPWEVSGDQK